MASKAATAAVVSIALMTCCRGCTITTSVHRISLASTRHLVLAKVSLHTASLIYILIMHIPWGRPETVAALQTFRKRHADAQRIQSQLASQPTTVDLAYYRSVLKNKAIVDDAEKLLNDFKPVTYDVNAHIKAIDTFETKAVSHTIFCFLCSVDP
jgi:hypothetical protein